VEHSTNADGTDFLLHAHSHVLTNSEFNWYIHQHSRQYFGGMTS